MSCNLGQQDRVMIRPELTFQTEQQRQFGLGHILIDGLTQEHTVATPSNCVLIPVSFITPKNIGKGCETNYF